MAPNGNNRAASPLAAVQVSREEVWITPEKILKCARDYFGGAIPCDPATEPDNPTRAERFYTAETNGLGRDWGSSVWLNPPYGGNLRAWLAELRRQVEAGVEAVALLPCGTRTSTGYWQRDVLIPRLRAICWVSFRVGFLRPVDERAHLPRYEPMKRNPYDSVIHGYGVDRERFARSFAPLGRVVLIQTVR